MIQRLYGDFYESGAGNNSIANAQAIGTLSDGMTWTIGASADINTGDEIKAADVDFVTIDDNTDLDVYSFTLGAESDLSVVLSPEGIEYRWSEEGGNGTENLTDMTKLSDLVLELMNDTGTVISTINNVAAGFNETLATTLAAGDYFMRISSDDDNAQFYKLAMSVTAIPEPTTLSVMLLSLMGLAGWRKRG